MAKPVLTAPERADLENIKSQKETLLVTLQNQIVTKTAEIPSFQEREDLFKSFFDYYNDDIIGHYDNELKALVGTEIDEPVTNAELEELATVVIESDQTALAALVLKRLFPQSPETNITRIPEFDGGGTIINPFNEQDKIGYQAFIMNGLQNGFGSPGNNITGVTTSTITPASTSFTVSSGSSESYSNGDVFVIRNASQVCVIQITNVNNTSLIPPPYTYTISFNFLIPPLGNIGSGQPLYEFTGFNNTERNTKNASFGDFQVLMNRLVDELEAGVTDQIALLNTQNSEMALNQDPDGTSEFAAATIINNSIIVDCNNYLILTDISNTGISGRTSQNAARLIQISAREAQIISAYTNRSEDYYEYRYSYANQRATFSGGTLIAINSNTKSLQNLTKFVQDTQDAIDVIDLMLA